jgi:hypothetical protein
MAGGVKAAASAIEGGRGFHGIQAKMKVMTE